MKKILSAKERDQLRLQHKGERDKRVCDRIKAVLLHDEGWSYNQIAHVLLLTDEAVRGHIADYEISHKLNPQSGGSTEKLSEEQSKLLEDHLRKHTYLYTKDIIAYVSSNYKITYTISGITHWLERHGFSYKKPAIIPGKANLESQIQWIAEYEELKKNLPPLQTICFIDGVHPTHNTLSAYGWIKKGERKEVYANTGRGRLNLSGAIDLLLNKVFVHEDRTLNAYSTIQFFKEIEAAYPKMDQVHIFCDNARYYRNKDVQAYLKCSKLKIHFLPPYSPNLNPIERLWKWMKERVLYNTYYREFEDFRTAILSFFYSLSNLDPGSWLGKTFASRVRDKFHPIGADLNTFRA